MEIFKQLKKLGYKHYIDLTVEKLDALPINSIEKKIEYSLVIDWFREKHKYSVSIHVDEDNSTPSNIKYWYCIDSFFEVPNNKIVREGIEEVGNFNSFEEAREQAILKAIELIKE